MTDNGGVMRPHQPDNYDAEAEGGLYGNYDTTAVKQIQVGHYAIPGHVTAIRIPGVPDLILDRPINPVELTWVSIGTDGYVQARYVHNRLAVDPTTVDRHEPAPQREAWYQWPLLMALYDDALDPIGACREAHGYQWDRLTFTKVTRGAGGYVVTGCQRCDDPQPRNAVAAYMIKALSPSQNDLDLRGTVAWLSDLDSVAHRDRPGSGTPTTWFDSMHHEEIGTLAALALVGRRACVAADGPGRADEAG